MKLKTSSELQSTRLLAQDRNEWRTFTRNFTEFAEATDSDEPQANREFTHALITNVYDSPSANGSSAANQLATHIYDMESQHPDALKIVTGDFNHCDAATALSALLLQQRGQLPYER
ncbi:endonuclease domain of the non-LTR retrotransposon LINE-1 [Elysia marginata]|uniref:Endonuclease domain of the non-LTR retrotransposon LINE-1 n=1 Tax=Elysia marginata TaxID=1093978 RepID=A0AAV4IFA6_9GAST|nr:endonuclease domain of the non-LTR retrotransposon LINE-1 [Elysia marginata]